MSKSNSRSIFPLLCLLLQIRFRRKGVIFQEMRWQRYINQKNDTFIYKRERRDHNYDYQPHVHNSNPSSQLILWVGPMTWKIKVLRRTFFFFFFFFLWKSSGSLGINQRGPGNLILMIFFCFFFQNHFNDIILTNLR